MLTNMSAMPVTPIRKVDITTRLIANFKEMIHNGQIEPGSKLPSERELAVRFGVSRPSLRQALKVLEIMGVLQQRVGDGTYLSSSASAILGEPMEFLVLLDGVSHLELLEARMMVEPELASRAAARATAEDIMVLQRIIKKMQASLEDRHGMTRLDVEFHDAIFRTAGNRVCRQMFGAIHRAVLTSILSVSVRADLEQVCLAHQTIYEAIATRDPELARERMARHLAEARGLFMRASVEPEQPTKARKSRNR
jgi:GntR family transcriptional repressor for pyruvate dehydrogenase complex